MNLEQRCALILCDEGLRNAILRSSGQIGIDTAEDEHGLLSILSTAAVDIVVLPWRGTPDGYSTARAVKNAHPGTKLVFYDRWANHPLSRDLLDKLGFHEAPVVSTRVLTGFFQFAMRHLFPGLFPDDFSPLLLEFTEFDMAHLRRIEEHIVSSELTYASSRIEEALKASLQLLGYEVDLSLTITHESSLVAGFRPDSCDLLLYVLGFRGDRTGRAAIYAVSKLLFCREASSAEASCVAITRSPGLGEWKPAREYRWHLDSAACRALSTWVDGAIALFMRDLTLRYFKVSCPQLGMSVASEDAFIKGAWRPS